MVRRYHPKRRPWRDKDKRMARVVELRGMGMSLRRIADRLAVDQRTVQRDLARWADLSANVRRLGAASRPTRGTSPHRNAAPPDSNIVPLRRSS